MNNLLVTLPEKIDINLFLSRFKRSERSGSSRGENGTWFEFDECCSISAAAGNAESETVVGKQHLQLGQVTKNNQNIQ